MKKSITLIRLIKRYFKRNLLFYCLVLGITFSCKQTHSKQFFLNFKSEKTLSSPIAFDLKKIKERGSLIAIIDNSTTGYFIYKGQPMGYEYDLLKLLAKELEVELKLTITTDVAKAFDMLNKGEGDIIAHNLTVTKKRKEKVAFTIPHDEARQVLIQRKSTYKQKNKLIRNPLELTGKQVYVRKSSSYATRLRSLSDEIGGDIFIIEEAGGVDTEALIAKVANGEIDYTIADDNIAKVNATYYHNIDIKTAVSFPQRIAWAVRKNAPNFLKAINKWMKKTKKTNEYFAIYSKYLKSPKASKLRVRSDFSSIGGQKISPYDELVKSAADKVGWDWKLFSAQIYQESRFDCNAQSWAGAIGLMQLMPATAERFGAENPLDPEQSITAATNYIKWLDKFWKDKVPDKKERIKFILASYNIGEGHVEDAAKLAKKYGRNPKIWKKNVEYFLLKKSQAKYYNDPLVRSGYCRGTETTKYVKEIMNRYQSYNLLIKS